MAKDPSYTRSQIISYFDRIRMPENGRFFNLDGLDSAGIKARLQWLVEQHLISVPFENLVLHYSERRVISTDPQHVFNKIVSQPGRGRGGYCMENNTLLHHVLSTLGFTVYMAGGRIYNPDKGRFGGFSHCVNIITIGDERVFVDVGMGARGPINPLTLSPSQVSYASHVKPAQSRLRHDVIPQNGKSGQKLWIYEYRKDETEDWIPQYCFTDTQFWPEDFEIMSYSTSTDPESIFIEKIMVVRFTRMDEAMWAARPEGETETPDGRVIRGAFIIDANNFKWRSEDGQVVREKTFKTDAERVEVLATYFGIHLSEAETQAIRGTTTEVKPI